MELLNKVKDKLEAESRYDFSSDFWEDNMLCILYDVVYATEAVIKAQNSKGEKQASDDAEDEITA